MYIMDLGKLPSVVNYPRRIITPHKTQPNQTYNNLIKYKLVNQMKPNQI